MKNFINKILSAKMVLKIYTLSSLLLVAGVTKTFAVNANWYYNSSSGSVNTIANWYSTKNYAGGTNTLADFTIANINWTFNSAVTFSLDASFNPSGTGGLIQVGDSAAATSVTLPLGMTLGSASIKVQVANLSKLIIQSATIPTFNALSTGSEVVYDGGTSSAPQIVTSFTYSKLTIGDGSAVVYALSSASPTVTTFIVTNHATYIYNVSGGTIPGTAAANSYATAGSVLKIGGVTGTDVGTFSFTVPNAGPFTFDSLVSSTTGTVAISGLPTVRKLYQPAGVDSMTNGSALTISTSALIAGRLSFVNSGAFNNNAGASTVITGTIAFTGTGLTTVNGTTPSWSGTGCTLLYSNSSAATLAAVLWPLSSISTTNVPANLILNGVGGVTNPAVSARNLQAPGNITLISGALTLQSALTLPSGATITRTAGSIATASPTATTSYNVLYNGSSLAAGLELPSVTTALNNLTLNLTNQLFSVTLTAPITVNGNLTVTAGTLADGGNIITGNGTSGNSFSLANGTTYNTSRIASPWFPTFTAPATTTFGNCTISYSGAGSFALPVPPNPYYNLSISNSGTKTSNSNPLMVTNNLAFVGGVLALNYGLSVGGTITVNFFSTLDIEDGGGATLFTIPTLSGMLGKLIVNRAAGISLSTPLTLAGISGDAALVLTNGILTTTSVNLLTIGNVVTNAITGGSVSSFVNGPMVLTLPVSYSSGGTFIFPFGDPAGPAYTPFQLLAPTTNSGTAATILAQMFATNAGGTPGAIVNSLNTNRYWSASILANPSSITTIGNIALTDPVVVSDNGVCYSTTQTGTYYGFASTVAGTTVTTTGKGTSALGYFVIGAINSIFNFDGTTVGTGGTFLSLTNIGGLFSAISAVGSLQGNSTVRIISSLNAATEGGTGETGNYPLNAFTGGYTLTIAPSSATQYTISGTGVASAAAMILVSGASGVIIDGSFGGSGQYLLFLDTNSTPANTGATIQFLNSAKNDTLRNCVIQNNGTTVSRGAVMIGIFSGGASGNSNSGIMISGNNISGSRAATPGVSNGIYWNGTSNVGNVNNVVSLVGNNIFNFINNGINVQGCGNNSKISGNSIYQPNSFTSAAAMTGMLLALSSAATIGVVVQGNYIGGNASALTGNAISGTWTCTSTSTFFPISGQTQGASNTTFVTVVGNAIGGISFTTSLATSTTPGVFTGITTTAGPWIFGASGNGNGNAIGAASGNGSITITAGNGAYVGGIYCSGSSGGNPIQIINNTISSITCTGASTIGYTFNAINTAGSVPFTISGNTIGSATSDAIKIGVSGTTTAGHTINGILATSTGTLIIQGNILENIIGYSTTGTITFNGISTSGAILSNNTLTIGGSPSATFGNTVGPLTSNSTGSLSVIRGINTSGAVSTTTIITIQGNTVSTIRSTTANTNTNTSAGIIGILATSNAAGQIIDSNTVSGIQYTGTAANVTVEGIAFGYGTSGVNVAQAGITRNKVFNLTNGYTGANLAQIVGIDLAQYINTTNGVATLVANNMVTLTPAAPHASVIGLLEELSVNPTTTGTLINFYFNSVYIGGTAPAATGFPSAAFQRITASGSKGLNIKNNIFINEQTGGGTGTTFPYCIINNKGTTGWPTGASNYNILGSNNSAAATIGCWATTNETFENWKNAGGSSGYADSASLSGIQVVFANTATGDLHLIPNLNCALDGQGIVIAGLNTDIDGDTRSVGTRPNGPDIGADEFPSCFITFTVNNLFLQGFYLGGGKMSPLLHLLGAASATVVDTVTSILYDGTTHLAVDSSKGILQINGTVVDTFYNAVSGNSYYIAVKHRNSIRTWSALAQTISGGASYDFSAGGGYNNSMVMLDVFYKGVYSGDINQDAGINASDKSLLQSVLSSFNIGVYSVTDMTGDGFVDEDDYRIIKNNIPIGVTVQHP